MCENLVGQTFGRLTVIEKTAERQNGKVVWLCKCTCGNIKKVTTGDMKSGRTQSCGCYMRERISETKKKNFFENNEQKKLYGVWCGIRERCYCESNKNYNEYGGRGIKMCDEWRESFNNFLDWTLTHGYKKGLSIDRIDNNGNYCPENCRFANAFQQANNKRTCRYVTINGITKTVAEWSRIYSINKNTIYARIRDGWSEVKAITTPILRIRTDIR